VHDQFNKQHFSTIQASFLNKKIHFEHEDRQCRVNLSLWDTAGQEIFHSLGPIYYRNSQGTSVNIDPRQVVLMFFDEFFFRCNSRV
jgi:Ras-related protein Rab-21